MSIKYFLKTNKSRLNLKKIIHQNALSYFVLPHKENILAMQLGFFLRCFYSYLSFHIFLNCITIFNNNNNKNNQASHIRLNMTFATPLLGREGRETEVSLGHWVSWFLKLQKAVRAHLLVACQDYHLSNSRSFFSFSLALLPTGCTSYLLPASASSCLGNWLSCAF